MYSLILMTAMTAAPQGPEFGGLFRRSAACYGTCDGQTAGCYGADRPGFGSRIRAFFSFGGCNGCNGCYGSCAGRTANACYGSLACYGSHACVGGMPPFDGGHPA